MAIPGLLIEYLINGALALIWLVPLLNKYSILENPFFSFEKINIAIIAILLYLLGMFIDYIAWIVSKPIKKIIRENCLKELGIEKQIEKGDSYRRETKIAIYAPELSREILMRSSRDRIARGALLNSIFGTIAFIVIMPQVQVPLIVGLILITICFFMWKGFEKVSYGFEIVGEGILNKKISSDLRK